MNDRVSSQSRRTCLGRANRHLLRLLVLSGLSGLAACSPELAQLEGWMTGVRDNTQPVTRTIAEPRKFQPYRYDLIEATGPFSPEKLAILQDPMQVRARGGLAPDVTRRRELLESFPLEQIHMVGSMRNQQVSAALLKVEETVYTARVGSFAGQNYGRITAIDETEIRLRELVQDAAGEWVEREATLRLQETGDETGR